MDVKETLLHSIERRLTIYADWVSQGGGIRSDASEDLYCDLLNTALGYDLQNMNWVEDNFPAIDLGDEDERLAVQVTSTGTAEKVKKTLTRFYDHGLEQRYDRLIVLIAGRADCKNRQFDHPGIELQIWGTVELVQEFRRLPVKKLREVDELLQERVDAPGMPRPVLHLPVPERRSPVKFQGRKKELAWIESELKAGTKPVVVAGLGGVGKTELAVHFAKKHWRGHAYFVRFRDTFTRTLADSVGQAIPVEERRGMDEAQTAALALDYLRRCEPGDLLILDNAEVTGKTWAELTRDPNYAQLRRLPMAILVTTRHRDTGGMWLGSLERDELRQIFREHGVNIPEADMDALITAVGEHTMTVDMIARTIRESWGAVTAEDILTAMKKSTLHDGDFEEIENDHDPEQRKIYAHLRALFDLSGISEDGRQALRCATLLPQGGMDAKLFRTALTEGAAREISKLEKRGWIDLKDGKLVVIHPVVRLVCKTELKPTEENCREFLRWLANWYDPKQYEKDEFQQLAELFSSVADDMEDQDGEWALWAGQFWYELGEALLSLAFRLKALEKHECNRPESLELALAYTSVAQTYNMLGRGCEALQNMQSAVNIFEKINPKDDLMKAELWCNLGAAYHGNGQDKEAEKNLLGALRIADRISLSDHPLLPHIYFQLGTIYRKLGKRRKAHEYFAKGADMEERIYPPNHPNRAMTYFEMGVTFNNQFSLQEALNWHLEALTIEETVLPKNHPQLARSYTSVGIAYGNLGNIDKSLEYMKKALEGWKKWIPLGKTRVYDVCTQIIICLCIKGRYREIGEYLDTICTIEKKYPTSSRGISSLICLSTHILKIVFKTKILAFAFTLILLVVLQMVKIFAWATGVFWKIKRDKG